MNRTTALTLKTRSWMNEEAFATQIEQYGIEWSNGNFYIGCKKSKKYPVVWCETYDMDLIKLAIDRADPAVIMDNFRAYTDTGTEELLLYAKAVKTKDQNGETVWVRESNYEDHISQINSWYLTKTGKYQPEEPVI